MGEFTYDVFLSHNSKDKELVRRLAERLRDSGLHVWFDEWIIRPGDDIYMSVEKGLDVSRVLVLCMSPNAFDSDWVTLERSTVLFRDPTNTLRRFIPLLLVDCDLPDTMQRYKYVDYRSQSDLAFKELLTACQSETESELSDPTAQLTGSVENKKQQLNPSLTIKMKEEIRKELHGNRLKSFRCILSGQFDLTGEDDLEELSEKFLNNPLTSTINSLNKSMVKFFAGNSDFELINDIKKRLIKVLEWLLAVHIKDEWIRGKYGDYHDVVKGNKKYFVLSEINQNVVGIVIARMAEESALLSSRAGNEGVVGAYRATIIDEEIKSTALEEVVEDISKKVWQAVYPNPKDKEYRSVPERFEKKAYRDLNLILEMRWDKKERHYIVIYADSLLVSVGAVCNLLKSEGYLPNLFLVCLQTNKKDDVVFVDDEDLTEIIFSFYCIVKK